ncbi:MAG: HlyD family efflux transporter periplasmic adaptor subunit [Cellulosilyticaceae bacterium]
MKKTKKNKSYKSTQSTKSNKNTQNSQQLSYTSYRSQQKSSTTYSLEEYRKSKVERPRTVETPSYGTKPKKTYDKAATRGNKDIPTMGMESPEKRRAEIKKKNKLTRAEILKIKERKRKAYRLRLYCGAMLIVFCVYGSIKLIQALSYPKISYQTVRMGVIDNSKKLEGIIIRDESVFISPDTGDLHYLVGEGQKVAKNKEVCMISEDKKVEAIDAQLTDVDRSIYNLQEKRENLSTYQPELYNLNGMVTQEMNQFYNQFGVRDTDKVYVLRKELNQIIQTRTDIYVQDNNERTDTLQANRVTLSQDLQGQKKVSTAKEAGIISYNVDGQEVILSSQTVPEMDYSQFKETLGNSKKGDNAKTILHAIANEPLFKIVKKDEWCIVTYLGIEEAQQYEQGKKYELIFPEVGNLRVLFTLETKEEQDNKVKVVFQTRDQINKFLALRTVDFTVGETRAEGLKIPLQAILEKNLFPIPEGYITEQEHQKGVIRLRGEVQEFIPIQIQYNDEGKSYILQEMNKTGALMIGDVIKHPENTQSIAIKEAVTQTGVYTVNGRYARFRPVEIVMSNEEYGIVDKGGRTKLKEFDQIISNPKSIDQDQLLRYMNIQNE